MSEDSPQSDVAFDTEAFQDWVDQTAETKGLSRSEVLDRMLSSYWILEELTGMMDATAAEMGEAGEGPPRRVPDEAEGDEEESHSEQDLSALIEEFQGLRAAILEGSERQGAPESQWASGGGAPAQRQPMAGAGATGHGVVELQRTVDELSRRVDDLEADHEAVTELEEEIAEIESTLGELERALEDDEAVAELESFARDLADEQSRLGDALTELRGQVAQLEDSQRELSGELSGLRADHAELEEMVDEEFDGIERVFQHLIDKTENLEYRLGGISDTHSEDMEPIDAYMERERRLADLKAEAQEKNIEKAVCDNCETKVDIALLDEPRCPSCDRSATGLKRAGRLPFSSHTFSTGPPPREGEDDPLADGGEDAPRREP